jgi:WD40 repeat protein
VGVVPRVARLLLLFSPGRFGRLARVFFRAGNATAAERNGEKKTAKRKKNARSPTLFLSEKQPPPPPKQTNKQTNKQNSSIAVHPTLPYLITCSDDMLAKLWDWDRGFSCAQVREKGRLLFFPCFSPRLVCVGVVLLEGGQGRTCARVCVEHMGGEKPLVLVSVARSHTKRLPSKQDDDPGKKNE